ncbi:MAG: hypothetical protein AB8B88_03170 [Devosiaceae bacterium]
MSEPHTPQATEDAPTAGGLPVASADKAIPNRRRRPVRAPVIGAAFFVIIFLLFPFFALGTPPGQRLVERAIEAPLLARLEASAIAPFTLQVDELKTTVGGATLRVELVGAVLSAPGLSLALEDVSVRVRYLDVLQRNLVPERIEVARAFVSVDDLSPMREMGALATVFPGSGFQSDPVVAIDDFSALAGGIDADAPSDSTVQMAQAEILESLAMDGLVNAFDALDQALAGITVGATWQSLESITVERIEFDPRPQAGLPLLRQPEPFRLGIERETAREVVARLESINRVEPISLVVRHAESGAPQGPAVLARIAGAEIGENDPFSHLLLRGLKTSDLTSALQSNGPITFESNLAAEIIITRQDDGIGVEQIVALFESDAGYLVAGEHSATILEFASIPMIYTRQSGRFDIVSARVQFQETGGVFNGTLEPAVQAGQAGLRLALQAPAYRLTIPAEPSLSRDEQRASAALTLDAFINDDAQQIDVRLLEMVMGEVQVAHAGLIDLSGDSPVVAAVGRSTPMRVVNLAALWPLPISPQARSWFLENIAEGSLDAAEFSFAAQLSDIEVRDGRAYLRDDMLSLKVPYQNLVMRTVGDLPPVFGLDGDIEITGRTVRMVGEDGIGRLASGEMIEVTRAEFFIPDHAQRDPFARLQLEMSGTASGFAQMALLDPIELGDEIPFDAETVTGDVELSTTIETVLADRIDRDAVRTTTSATVTNFASIDPINGRAVTGGAFTLEADESGTSVVGEVLLDGVPTELNYNSADGGGLQIALRLDAAGRRQLGLDFGDYLTGTIDVEIGDETEAGTRPMVVDLTNARLTIPEIGWSKAPGVPGRASFELRESEAQREVRNLVIAAQGLAVRGNLEFRDGDLRLADFESIAVEDVGRFGLVLTRNATSTTARIRGERFVLKPDLLRGDREAAGALALDIQVDELVTQEGSRLSNLRLNYSQTRSAITAFDLRAQHSDGTELVGSLAPTENGNVLLINSGNAGTFLRFLGLYDRAQGGRATLILEPSSVGGRVVGQLLLSDYQIVDEPAMQSIFNDGARQASNSGDIVLPGEFETSDRIDIQVTNVTFDRTPERLVIHKAEGWGPSLGGNIQGIINYEADDVRLRGTYVPFFTINNFFSRIPIIGQALGGRDSEGLLGVTFELVGSVDQPQLRVNPMSLLAPGVFRNIFEFQQGG